MSRISEVCQATWDAFRNTKDVVLRERLHAVLLSNDGRTRREIAEILFCEVSDFKPWLTIYKEEGLEGIQKSLTQSAPKTSAAAPATPSAKPSAPSAPKAKPKKDLAPALVTSAPAPVDSQLQADVQTMIRECLRFSPKIYGRRTNVWSTKALADVVAKNLGREVPRDQIRSFLQSAGVAKLETTQQFVKRTARMKAIDPATLPGIAAEPTATGTDPAAASTETSNSEAALAAAPAPVEAQTTTSEPVASPDPGGEGQFADPWAAGASAPTTNDSGPEASTQNDALAVAGAPETTQNADS